MNEIEIRVEKKGTATGSVGWLNRILRDEDTVLRTGHSISGSPIVTLHAYVWDDYKEERVHRSETLAWLEYGYPVLFYQDANGDQSLFGVHLTAAAKQRVCDLADLAGGVLHDWTSKDDDQEDYFALVYREKEKSA
jgi:hypothetical protein